MPEAISINDAVSAALEPSETSETSETSEIPAVSEEVLSKEDAEQASQIFRALKDPTQSINLIRALAAGSGINLMPDSTPAEVRDAREEIRDDFEDKLKGLLGADFDFLSPAFAKVQKLIDVRIESLIEEKTKGIREIQESTVREKSEAFVQSALNSVVEELKISPATLTLMLEEMKHTLPADGVKPEDYFRKINKLVAPLAASKPISPGPLSRLGSAGASEKAPNNGKMSLNAAIAAALKENS